METNLQENVPTTLELKKLSQEISQIKSKKDYIELFKMLKKDSSFEYSKNLNGIWFDLKKLSPNTINSIRAFIREKRELKGSNSSKATYQIYSKDDIDDIPFDGPRLSNQEKSIIKKIKTEKSYS